MGHLRPRFNAKARQSGSSSCRKKRKRRSELDQSKQEHPDPNALILQPKSKELKEEEQKERLRQDLIAQSDSRWNRKKKRRLEKYIEKKLKKEERVALFEKLSQSQAQLSTTLHLQSSSTLGTGKPYDHQEKLDRLEDKHVRRELQDWTGGRKRRRTQYDIVDSEVDVSLDEHAEPMHSEDGVSLGDFAAQDDSLRDDPLIQPAVGSALRKNSNACAPEPIVRAKVSAKKSWKDKRQQKPTNQNADDSSDTSFNSSDSAYDSSDSEGGSRANQESKDSGQSDETAPKPERLGFKEWAIKQLNAAKGYDTPVNSTNILSVDIEPPPPTKKIKVMDGAKQEMRGPLGEDIDMPTTSFAQRLQPSADTKEVVAVTRSAEVEELRLHLPIIAEEQPIMEAILLNAVVIICGETGSGKTTQVPQFLYEAGFGSPGSDNPGMIGITQPRRVAAMSMATRVVHELSLNSSRVSYQIRYDATVSPSTSIKFMTDGVLLRELATDFLLQKYSVIIIDEAHERSMNTDILIGVLSRVLKLREDMWKEGKSDIRPLRLVIMSATLRVSDFAENKTLFPSPPPVINVPARQHPVTIHFSRRTSPDYVSEAIKKASKIHSRLPPGGILIFLTGQNEITGVCRKLEARFSLKSIHQRKRRRVAHTGQRLESDENTESRQITLAQADLEAEELDLGILKDVSLDSGDEKDDCDSEALESDDDQQINQELGIDVDETDTPMHIVPLYSLLSSEKQLRVFEPPPSGHRLVVVSTNIAETSLTIPGIRYVIDCGRAKERHHDPGSGVQSFQINWISKASAAQRAGRAGRTGPGHCYRLYSSALFEHHFETFTKPEILRIPIEGIVLQMKSLHIDVVTNFPFPTPPDRDMLRKAEKVLMHLGALHQSEHSTSDITGMLTTGGQITELGKSMALFPLSPRFSRMLVSSHQHGCLPYIIAIVSAMSVGDPFLQEEGLFNEEHGDSDSENEISDSIKEARRLRRKAYFQSQQMHASLGSSTSDIFRTLSVVGAYEYAGGGRRFCDDHFVRQKTMEEIHKLGIQITNIVKLNFQGVEPGLTMKLQPPNDHQIKVIKQLITASFIDQVAVRKDRVDKNLTRGTQYANTRGVPYRALGIDEDVYIHPSSVVAASAPPEFVVYSEIFRSSQLWMKGITIVNPAWLSVLGKPTLCSLSKPNNGMAIPLFGPDRWELPPVHIQPDNKV